MGQFYDRLWPFPNLYAAYRLASKGKRGKKEVVTFSLEADYQLWQLSEELRQGIYRPGEYRKFTIYDPKVREIQALAFRDRVVQRCLCDQVLKPYFEPRLVYDCAACRVNKGTHFAMNRLSGFLRAFYRAHGTAGYFLKCDVRKYFASVHHGDLKRLLANFPDKRMREYLYMVIDSYHGAEGVGIPMGNQSSQWFALYYLNKVDRLIKEKYRIKYYSRYMDDLILIHEDKGYLQECLLEIRRVMAEELHLSLNQKTQIFPISQGVDYLGFRFYLTDTGKVIRRLRTSSKRRWKRRLKSFTKKYAAGEVTLDEIRRSIASYNGHLSHGHTYYLRKRVYGRFILRTQENLDIKQNEGCEEARYEQMEMDGYRSWLAAGSDDGAAGGDVTGGGR